MKFRWWIFKSKPANFLLYASFFFVAVIGGNHERILKYIQVKYGVLDRIVVGCAKVDLESDSFFVLMKGGKSIGIKYYGMIRTNKKVESDQYVFLKGNGKEEIHLISLDSKQVEMAERVLYEKNARLSMVDGKRHPILIIKGYKAVESASPIPDGVRVYYLPDIHLEIMLYGVSYHELPFSLQKVARCSGSA